MEKEFIKKKTDWIRTIQPGETKKGYVLRHEDLDTLSTLLTRFNKSQGMERGVFVTGKRDWYEKSFTITCYKIEDYEQYQDKFGQHYPRPEDRRL